ncbi:MerR family transcriptional regulator [Planococcus antarcticus DSM 14505]|uniref:MerR family transcriptional regulator n=1 Tax=Planococcus antarcticus DSM 14505 TaxID=1185653 RepID=A0A1C7DE56_9BACL|nr:MerR family transcriptional regulator [Planococcus antarcticus]ANU09728.1 MerR family transcriptional regulator [Planococcus antarcticus DSM 14505]EIM05433.1 MerR family transcriptional regulator [Planococcus antarcticus DSM 14505]
MYNIKAAAKILDMPKVTIRSWETRYSAITPARTESGHRLYSDQNLEDLKWLKIQVQDNGVKISEAVKKLHASRKQFIVTKDELLRKEALEYEQQIDQLFQAAAEMDTERFNYLLDLHFSLFHHRTVFFYIIAPLMVRIGEAWEDGAISVAHEHMITHIVQQRFNQFSRIFQVSPNLPKVIALSPSGEQHQLGLLLFTLFLRENGFSVVYIGPDTPLEGLEEMVTKQNFKLMCMSIATSRMLPLANKYIDALAKANPEMHFILGGQGVDCEQIEGNRWYLGSDVKFWQQWLDEQNF